MKTVIMIAIFSIFTLNTIFLSSHPTKEQFSKKDSTEIYRNTSEAKEGTFKLKHDYPININLEPKKYTWKKINFKDTLQTESYMLAVLNYFLSENPTPVGTEKEWFLNTSWFHAPGLASKGDGKGRESLHGLTKEKTPEHSLHKNLKSPRSTWAIGFYNDIGATTIGKAWKNIGSPKSEIINFDEHTVSIKFLFTRANTSEIPYLANTLAWKANTSRNDNINLRKIGEVNLIQVDIAVKDLRSSIGSTGWVFGTFVYNKDYLSNDIFNSKSKIFRHLVPIGLMWEGGGQVVTSKYKKYFYENPDIVTKGKDWDLLYSQSKGFNGIVDNPEQNCMSCHVSLKNPSNKYDYSLQLAYGFDNYKIKSK